MRIAISFQNDRTRPGKIQAFDDAGVIRLGPADCLGKADSNDARLHGNPDRNPLRPFGDTPTGEYRIVRLVSHSGNESDTHTYGSYPSILLDPVSGDALAAERNGRSGLMIHGGVPSASGDLRPTHGCVRVSEDHQRDLVAIMVRSIIGTSSVTVTEIA